MPVSQQHTVLRQKPRLSARTFWVRPRVLRKTIRRSRKFGADIKRVVSHEPDNRRNLLHGRSHPPALPITNRGEFNAKRPGARLFRNAEVVYSVSQMLGQSLWFAKILRSKHLPGTRLHRRFCSQCYMAKRKHNPPQTLHCGRQASLRHPWQQILVLVHPSLSTALFHKVVD